jgi:hypothetical protein
MTIRNVSKIVIIVTGNQRKVKSGKVNHHHEAVHNNFR